MSLLVSHFPKKGQRSAKNERFSAKTINGKDCTRSALSKSGDNSIESQKCVRNVKSSQDYEKPPATDSNEVQKFSFAFSVDTGPDARVGSDTSDKNCNTVKNKTSQTSNEEMFADVNEESLATRKTTVPYSQFQPLTKSQRRRQRRKRNLEHRKNNSLEITYSPELKNEKRVADEDSEKRSGNIKDEEDEEGDNSFLEWGRSVLTEEELNDLSSSKGANEHQPTSTDTQSPNCQSKAHDSRIAQPLAKSYTGIEEVDNTNVKPIPPSVRAPEARNKELENENTSSKFYLTQENQTQDQAVVVSKKLKKRTKKQRSRPSKVNTSRSIALSEKGSNKTNSTKPASSPKLAVSNSFQKRQTMGFTTPTQSKGFVNKQSIVVHQCKRKVPVAESLHALATTNSISATSKVSNPTTVADGEKLQENVTIAPNAFTFGFDFEATAISNAK